MATYLSLLTTASTLADTTGQTDVEEVMKVAMVEALKYVATKITVPELRARATYTWVDGDETIPIGGGGFAVSSFTTPIRLYVNGVPYDYREWLEWLDLTNAPGGYRWTINQPATRDIRPARCWTINHDDEVEILPLPVEDDVIVLYYDTEPAAYSDGGTPELNARFHNILVNGALLVGKEFLRDPDAILDMQALFSGLDDQIKELSIHQDSQRKRRGFRISSRYSA